MSADNNAQTPSIVSIKTLPPPPLQQNLVGPDGKVDRAWSYWLTQIFQRLGGGWNNTIDDAQTAAEFAAIGQDQTGYIDEQIDQVRTEAAIETIPFQAAADQALDQAREEAAVNTYDASGLIEDAMQQLRDELQYDNFGALQQAIADSLQQVVISFNGRQGVVVPVEGDYTLTLLGDTTISSPSSGQVIRYNGSQWVNGSANGTITPARILLTATAAQTVFNTSPVSTIANGTNTGSLIVYRNGVKQIESASYTVSGANQITFGTGLTAGDTVEIYSFA